MTEKMTEQDLLAECRNGSRKAFGLLYQANQKTSFFGRAQLFRRQTRTCGRRYATGFFENF